MPQDYNFHRACEKGEKAAVAKLLRKTGKDILKQPGLEYGQTPLHVCCEFGREELVQYFLSDKLSGKVELNATDKNGWTPLHAACKNGHLDIIELLIKKGAYLRASTNESASPLHYFVRNGDQKDPLKHNKVMKMIIDGSLVDQENKHGETPLHQAAMKDRFQNVTYLVNAGADPNRKTRHGETPLHFAARGNSHESTTILLQANADPTIESSEGVHVYSVARKWEQSKIKKILIDWYLENNREMPPEMKDDLSEGKGDSGEREKKNRRKKKNRSSGTGQSPKSSSADKREKKNIDRVASLKGIPEGDRERRKSEDAIAQRVDGLHQRTAGTVRAFVQDWEKKASPQPERKGTLRTQMDNDAQRARIQNLKEGASNLSIDVDAIEEQVTSQQKAEEESNPIYSTLKDLNSKKLHLNSINDSKLIESLKDGWECKVCKNHHADVPLFFFCAVPDDYENLDGTEKANRTKLSADLCSIEKKTSQHYIRGLVELPFRQSTSSSSNTGSGSQIAVTWGLWVAVSSSDFDKVVNNWNSHESFVLEGTINNNLPVYNDTLGLSVTLTTRPGGFRPLITMKSLDSQLAKDSTGGITIDRLSSLIEFVFHTSK